MRIAEWALKSRKVFPGAIGWALFLRIPVLSITEKVWENLALRAVFSYNDLLLGIQISSLPIFWEGS
jgi:hypothetical protein